MQPTTALARLDQFRQEVYRSTLGYRKDSLFELLDALTLGSGPTALVRYSLAASFRRQWASVPDALADGSLEPAALHQVLPALLPPPDPALGGRPVWAIDATIWPRPQARTSRRAPMAASPCRRNRTMSSSAVGSTNGWWSAPRPVVVGPCRWTCAAAVRARPAPPRRRLPNCGRCCRTPRLGRPPQSLPWTAATVRWTWPAPAWRPTAWCGCPAGGGCTGAHRRIAGRAAVRLRDPAAADRWTWLVALALWPLWLARPLVADRRLPWERPLPPDRLTPGRVRRALPGAFAHRGTPARAPQSRGTAPGRRLGQRPGPPPRQPIVQRGTPSRRTKPKAAA